MKSTDGPVPTSAVVLFGERERLYSSISTAIREARIKEGLLPLELGELACLDDPTLVSEVDERRRPFSSFKFTDVLAMLAQLGISIERILPLSRKLTDEESSFWGQQREELNIKPMVASGVNADLDPSCTLHLFLRLQALKELFTDLEHAS